MPQEWKDATIITIYKNKGDKAECGVQQRNIPAVRCGKSNGEDSLEAPDQICRGRTGTGNTVRVQTEPINIEHYVCSVTDLGKIP